MALPTSEVSLAAIALEDVLSVLREVQVLRVAVFVVIGARRWTLEKMGDRAKRRSDMMSIDSVMRFYFNAAMQILRTR